MSVNCLSSENELYLHSIANEVIMFAEHATESEHTLGRQAQSAVVGTR
jgi:hypothetical protein